jgi:hypothetical protein
VPTELIAETLKMYVATPQGELPKLVPLVQFADKVLHDVPPFEEYSTKYPVIVLPPLFAGAVHDTPISPSLYGLFNDVTVAVTPVTCPGTVTAETAAVLEKAAAEPPALIAVTRQRIGLILLVKKSDGGEYDELVAPAIDI